MIFQPTRPDGRSYRNLVVEAFNGLSPGMVLSYAQLAGPLDLDPERDKAKIQAAVRAANKVLLELHQRGIANVRAVGYRVLPAREHVIVANGHQSKADKALVRALGFYEGANLSEMTPVERKLHEGQHMLAQAIVQSHKHLSRRIDMIESILAGGGKIING